MNIPYLFGFFLFLFSFLGVIRGWRKELLLAFGLILALALNILLEKYIPIVSTLPQDGSPLFWIRMDILLVMAYFGYQTAVVVSSLASRARIYKSRDRVFGLLMGLLNGYLFAGSTLFYLNLTNNYLNLNINSSTEPTAMQVIQFVMPYMAPRMLGEPFIYFAVILVFIFVLIVYI